MNSHSPLTTVDLYLAEKPKEVRSRLRAIRELGASLVPEATEAIKYDMPTMVLNGNMICYGAFKNHISVFPFNEEMESAIPDLLPYRAGRGTAQFPHNQPLPLELIGKMIEMRAAEFRAKKK